MNFVLQPYRAAAGAGALFAAIAVILALAPGAHAADPKPFGTLACQADGDVRHCPGSTTNRVRTFDGVPLDANVTLPATGTGDYPLVVLLHGWGGAKADIDSGSLHPSARGWAQRGYAVLSYSARGFGNSCGQGPLDPDPICAQRGWVRLADARYEARDTQHLAGLLADEGLIHPRKIGVTGLSYGGGQSMALGILRDRIWDAADGKFKPWTSPDGKAMRIAAAAPTIPWSDLTYSLMPNGRTLDYVVTGSNDNTNPIGVMKASFVTGLLALGKVSGYYAPPGQDPDADLPGWYARVAAGEPYEDFFAKDIAEEITAHHSPYHLPFGDSVAPMFISNGWTDDLFPADEGLRIYNRIKRDAPHTPVQMLLADYGHQRGQGKPEDLAVIRDRIADWFDAHVKGTGKEVAKDVTALTQSCSGPSGGPFRASTWQRLHPGEVRLDGGITQTVVSAVGDPRKSVAVDPIAAGNNPCVQTDATNDPGTAVYEQQVGSAPLTLMGSPTVIANLRVTSLSPGWTQLAARLWDADPSTGKQRLIARGVYRPSASPLQQVFQLHPNGYRFEAGHEIKLELLGSDSPYARTSNDPFLAAIDNLELRLPVAEAPDCRRVHLPAPPVAPGGATPVSAGLPKTRC